MTKNILAIDQGTTSSRAILFGPDYRPRATGQREFTQILPRSGWVEHDPEEIWASVIATAKEAVAGGAAAIGITNQRETTVVWDAETGAAVHNAIVWQDRRTAEFCAGLKAQGAEAEISAKTGLLADPYFSATKVRWILENVEGARARAEAGKLRFGTMDSFLIWRLTGGRVHATDATNAARTMLYNIHESRWDEDICRLMGVPMSMLPEVRDCAAEFGVAEAGHLGVALPILGVAGDQQAATVGQACFGRGMMKSTYGTGCFALLNTGSEAFPSKNKLLTTIAYQIGGQVTYALEGSIFIAGAVVQWLRDGLGILKDARESGAMAASSDPEQAVYLVPAFVGLGAPYWDAECRGAIYGLSRGTGPDEITRAALESVGYQTLDLLEAMKADGAGAGDTVLRVDGGMTASDWTMQFLADVTQAPVDRPQVLETTALGAAWLAGMTEGSWPGQEAFAASWALDRRFEPAMAPGAAAAKYAGWKDAVARTLSR